MKKLISLFTTLCIVFSMLGTFTVFAEETATDITEIYTLAELEAFRDDVNNGNTYEGKTVKLTADIDMSDKYGADINGEEISWSPIGTKEQPFNGVFDGCGYTINGLYINSKNMNSGLFGHTNNKSIIKNLIVDGCINVNTDTNKSQYSGAVVGHNQGIIECCINEASINAIEALNGGIISGGIAGFSKGIIRKCSNNGVVSTKTYLVGGICGRNFGLIENCFNAGTVSGQYLIGGLCAQLCYCGRISNCYNIGSVDGDDCVGEMVGDDGIKVIDNVYYSMTYKPEETTSDIGTAKTLEQFASGEVAYLLGDEWGQNIGVDEYPVIGGDKVYLVNNTYTNTAADTETEDITEISTLAELEAFRDDVNSGNTYDGKTVKLTADIDMSDNYGEGKESWTPISNSRNNVFSGTFDGCNHTVNNLYINILENTGADGYGLLGFVDGTIKNLNVNGSVNAYSDRVAGIVVSVGENGAVINCSFDGAVKGNTFVGGIAVSAKLISNCHCSGTVDGIHMVGGIVSSMSRGLERDGIVENCTNESTVTAGSMAGGIVGVLNIYATAKGCINKGEVKGVVTEYEDAEMIGGIAGANENSIIENCYNTGSVLGNQKVGGITGMSEGPSSEYYTNKLAVKNCYNIGNVTAINEETSENISSIIGENTSDNGEIANNYYLDTCISDAQATALTTEQFADKTNFANWDFETVWDMDETLNRPVLRSNKEAADEVIEISTLAELEAFRDDVNNGNTYEGKTVKLTADIDMSKKYGEGKESWTPIAISDWDNDIYKPFSGTFDGDNHTINGLYINLEERNVALFSHIEGTLKNLNVKGSVSTTNMDGEAAGIAVAVMENASIIDCTFDGTVKSPHYAAGGIAAENFNVISGCIFKGKVEGMHLSAGISCNIDDGAIITNCINEGEIIGTVPVGGITGAVMYHSTITNCINKGSVTGRTYIYEGYNPVTSMGIGGIAGALETTCSIENCYNTGVISGNTYTGGILGSLSGDTFETATVRNCYNFGNITSTLETDSEHYISGIIGSLWELFSETPTTIPVEAINCYYLSGTADKGMDGTDLTTALTTEQFADKTNFINWDFDTVWEMDANLGRPILRSNTEEPPIETHTHTLVYHAAVAATCTETGTGEYWKCEGTDACNKMFSDTNGITEIMEIPTTAAIGHTEVTDVAIEPTCETDGKTAGSHCSVCNTIITAQTIVPKLNHNWGAWNITTEPTDETTGKAERICGNDNTHKDSVDLPVLTDTTVWTAGARVEPTETENGSQVYTSIYGTVTVILPATGSEYDYSIKYENGKAIVTVPQDGTYTVIFAAYDNGRLLRISAQDMQLVKGENSPISPQNFNANGKVKVMLWDSLMGMKPLCAADGN